jgi:S1-C subfamily serine protease
VIRGRSGWRVPGALCFAAAAAGVAIGYAVPRRQAEVVAEPVAAAPPSTISMPASAPASSAVVTSREVAKRALAYTVFVRSGGAYGAGVVLDRVGHVLTCQHVVEGNDTARVTFSERHVAVVRVIDRDKGLDLALLKLDGALPGGVSPASEAPMGSVVDLEMGDEVFAMGAPRKLGFSLSRGIVSYTGRPYQGAYFLQTDVPTNPGSSGGPVLDARGALVGIVSFVYRESDGLAFALPIDYAYRRFSRQLRPALSNVRASYESRLQSFEGWLQARSAASAVQKSAAATGPTSPPEAAALPDTRHARGGS